MTGPLTASGIYQVIAPRGRRAGVAVYPHRFQHHFSHTWLDVGYSRNYMSADSWTGAARKAT